MVWLLFFWFMTIYLCWQKRELKWLDSLSLWLDLSVTVERQLNFYRVIQLLTSTCQINNHCSGRCHRWHKDSFRCRCGMGWLSWWNSDLTWHLTYYSLHCTSLEKVDCSKFSRCRQSAFFVFNDKVKVLNFFTTLSLVDALWKHVISIPKSVKMSSVNPLFI